MPLPERILAITTTRQYRYRLQRCCAARMRAVPAPLLPVVITSDPYHRNLPGETVAPKLSEHLFGVKTRHLQGTNLFLCRWTPGRA